MSDAPGLFVSGTDTGVGKTVVSTGLVRAFRARGYDVAGMKPVETGVGPEGPLDALALQRAAGAGDPLEDVCPQRFALPAAPSVAARDEDRELDLEAIRAAFARLCAKHAAVIVEGAGGLLVPLAPRCDTCDLVRALGLPVVLVARSALGTINHCLLSIEALERRGLALAGVVISHATGELSRADRLNLDALREHLGERLIGEVPPLRSGEEASSQHFRLEPLLAQLRLG